MACECGGDLQAQFKALAENECFRKLLSDATGTLVADIPELTGHVQKYLECRFGLPSQAAAQVSYEGLIQCVIQGVLCWLTTQDKQQCLSAGLQCLLAALMEGGLPVPGDNKPQFKDVDRGC